jgi:hypothetical protein
MIEGILARDYLLAPVVAEVEQLQRAGNHQRASVLTSILGAKGYVFVSRLGGETTLRQAIVYVPERDKRRQRT